MGKIIDYLLLQREIAAEYGLDMKVTALDHKLDQLLLEELAELKEIAYETKAEKHHRIRCTIMRVLANATEPMTVSQIMKAGHLEDYSNQMVGSMVTQLVHEEKISRMRADWRKGERHWEVSRFTVKEGGRG